LPRKNEGDTDAPQARRRPAGRLPAAVGAGHQLAAATRDRTAQGVTYEWRDLDVANPGAIPARGQRNNALAIADNLGDRISLQLTWHF